MTSQCTGRLLKLVTDLGKRKWDEVAEQMSIKKPRSMDQCKDRFMGKVNSPSTHLLKITHRFASPSGQRSEKRQKAGRQTGEEERCRAPRPKPVASLVLSWPTCTSDSEATSTCLVQLIHVSEWSEEDDRTLVAAQDRLGDRWDLMTKLLEGR